MAWIAPYGLISLFAVSLAERFVPLLPSYGLLIAVGVGAADGAWSLPAAFTTTALGSMTGCAACFYALRGLGKTRSIHLLNGAGGLFGMSVERIERGIESFRLNQTTLAFMLQLVPTARLFTPAFAALLRVNSRRFLAASAGGVALWNGLFISIGYSAFHARETANTTVLALTALCSLLLAETALFWIVRRVCDRRKPGATLCRA